MFISKVTFKNFRNFKESEIYFNDGVNVIIGHNNAGKTNILKALSLIFDSKGRKKLGIDDFSKQLSFKELNDRPPKISVAVTIEKGEWQEDGDLCTVGDWLINLKSDYEALLTYEFFLPEAEVNEYRKALSHIDQQEDDALNKTWKVIERDFIKKYKSKVWGGNPISQNQAQLDKLQDFDFQFLDAIRDVERDMLSGQNTLLRDVLDFFLDYDIKSVPETEKSQAEKEKEIREKESDFAGKSRKLINELQGRMEEGKEEILSYAKETGASSFNNAVPKFDGSISETEMFSALNLIVEYETGIEIPATHNGLGYNNLIFMSLLLAKMQVEADGDYMGSNSKIFPILAIEEPEAHLHPSMQRKFLKFLKKNRKQRKVRQVFITTHSTHIASAVSLDEIICLHRNEKKTKAGYPGETFDNPNSKKYVERFLDATKSDMLFADKIILVEGITEQLLVPVLSKYLNENSDDNLDLEDNHVTVINIGGRYFEHFLQVFNIENSDCAIAKKVACLSDRDPVRKGIKDKNYVNCYPFEYEEETKNYDYENNSDALLDLNNDRSNVKYFVPKSDRCKTFEYDMVWSNPTQDLLLTESISNRKELKELMTIYNGNNSDELLQRLAKGKLKKNIRKSLEKNNSFNEKEKCKAIIASRYLNSIGKGENALELAGRLSNNLEKMGSEEYQEITVPQYIKSAIKWICR